MKEIHHDAHLIWANLKDKYDEVKYDAQIQEVSESFEGRTISASETEPHMTVGKIQEGKDSVAETSPLMLLHIRKFRIWNSEVPDLAERLKDTSQVKSPLLQVLLSHFMIIISAVWPCLSDSDDDNGKFMIELEKMNKKSRKIIIEMMKQHQEIEI
jgi:hypothetical protein